MNIVILSLSDAVGGASAASYRLMDGLRKTGHSATLLVGRRTSGDKNVVQASPAWRLRIPFLAEAGQIFVNNGFCRRDLFRVSTGSFGLPLHRHPAVREADAVVIGWVNQGFLSLGELGRIHALGKPMLWIMHDMWNATGICHLPGRCTHFAGGCGMCPLLHGCAGKNDLSRRIFGRKRKAYAQMAGMKFVAVSSWLRGQCLRSPLMAGSSVEVVPNPFPADDFTPVPCMTRTQLGLPKQKHLIIMAAARLDDPVKDLPLAIETLNVLSDSGCGSDVAAVFVGTLAHAGALEGLRLPHVVLGPVYDAARLRQIYAHADIVLSTSHYETMGYTLLEGLAAGAYPIACGVGGQSGIITDAAHGTIVGGRNPSDIADAIAGALRHGHDRRLLHAMAKPFSDTAAADRIVRLLRVGDVGAHAM